MRNFVAKNDFNRASTHRDKKNDYTRSWDIEDEWDFEEEHPDVSDEEALMINKVENDIHTFTT